MGYEIFIVTTNSSEKINAQIWSSDRLSKIVSIKDEAIDLGNIDCKKQVNTSNKPFKFRNPDEIPEYYPKHYQIARREELPRFPQLYVPKIILVAGNVGRNFVKKLIKIENAYEETRYEIFSVLKPGASRDEIFRTAIHVSKSLTKNDFIILWPNDVSVDKMLNLDYYMPKFEGKKVLLFSEPYAKNTSKNDGIYAYNKILEREIYHIEAKYPNLKLFDCNYFLRKNNYLGFKHELRGYAKYILAKYVLFCIRFGFGYHMTAAESNSDSSLGTNKETYVPYTNKEIFNACELQSFGKPELVATKKEEDEEDHYYKRRYTTSERSIQTTGEYMSRPSSSEVENKTDDVEKKGRRNSKRRRRRRRNRRQSEEIQESSPN